MDGLRSTVQILNRQRSRCPSPVCLRSAIPTLRRPPGSARPPLVWTGSCVETRALVLPAQVHPRFVVELTQTTSSHPNVCRMSPLSGKYSLKFVSEIALLPSVDPDKASSTTNETLTLNPDCTRSFVEGTNVSTASTTTLLSDILSCPSRDVTEPELLFHLRDLHGFLTKEPRWQG